VPCCKSACNFDGEHRPNFNGTTILRLVFQQNRSQPNTPPQPQQVTPHSSSKWGRPTFSPLLSHPEPDCCLRLTRVTRRWRSTSCDKQKSGCQTAFLDSGEPLHGGVLLLDCAARSFLSVHRLLSNLDCSSLNKSVARLACSLTFLFIGTAYHTDEWRANAIKLPQL
jgi:hypothetical protein